MMTTEQVHSNMYDWTLHSYWTQQWILIIYFLFSFRMVSTSQTIWL